MLENSNAASEPRQLSAVWASDISTGQDTAGSQSGFEEWLRLQAEIARQQVSSAAAADRRRDLCGMCAIAAAVLHARLAKHGLYAWFVVWHGDGQGHCYVEYGDYLVDITASQFGRQDIEVQHKATKPDEVYWQGKVRFRDLQQLRSHLEYRGWPEDQLP